MGEEFLTYPQGSSGRSTPEEGPRSESCTEDSWYAAEGGALSPDINETQIRISSSSCRINRAFSYHGTASLDPMPSSP